MPWSETNRMEQRARFVLEALQGRFTMSELCYRFSVSRKTGYKWLARYHAQGVPGCEDRPRAPIRHPNATSDEVVARVLRARSKHPTWGPRTLHAALVRDFPEIMWPAPSTIGEMLKRNGLIKQKRRRRVAHPPWRSARTRPDRPNRVWTADFKGQFKLRDGTLCYPLTVADAYSRYLLVCRGLRGTLAMPTRQAFTEAFREYGMPDVIHTDNGVPFYTPNSGLGLSTLSVWFLKLGITLERSRPGKPQDNGRHERMHRTLKQEAAQPPHRDESAQQRALNQFRRVYNEQRPHHALQLQTPSQHFSPSQRRYPEDIEDPTYPADFELRKIGTFGVFRWKHKDIFVSSALRHETVGLEYVAEDLFSVYFGRILLGRFDVKAGHFTPGLGT